MKNTNKTQNQMADSLTVIEIVRKVQGILQVDRKAIRYENTEEGLVIKMQYGPYTRENIQRVCDEFRADYFSMEGAFLIRPPFIFGEV